MLLNVQKIIALSSSVIQLYNVSAQEFSPISTLAFEYLHYSMTRQECEST